MGVDPEDFRDHSERLSSDYSDEISERCAISRKYYYAFHYALAELENHPDYRDVGDGHREIERFFEERGDPDISELFDDLQSKRQTADYDIDEELSELEKDMFEADLVEFIDELESISL